MLLTVLNRTRSLRSLLHRLNDPIVLQRLAPTSSLRQPDEKSTNQEYSDLVKGVYNRRYKWQSYGLLEHNTMEEIEEKLSMLQTSLSLSSEERERILVVYPNLLNKEKREIEERIRHFREDWHCSDDQMKEMFTIRRMFQSLSLEDLKRMHSIYSNEWKIEKERLPKALFNYNYFTKYKREYLVQEDEDVRSVAMLRKTIITFYEVEFGKDISQSPLPYQIIASKIFEKNSKEEVKEKLSYLSSSLLLSQEEAYRLMCFVPVILNESFEELKKKVEFFKVKLGCSEKEWKRFYLSRGVIVTCPLWQLELMYKMLSEEYDLQSKDIIRIFSDTQFTPSRLSEMIESLEERKYLFSIIYRNSNQMRSWLIRGPLVLWMKPEVIKRRINLLAQGLGFDSLGMINSAIHEAMVFIPESYILNTCKQHLSLFMADLNYATKKSIDLFEIFPALREAKAWPEKYNDAMKRLASDENKQMIKEKEIQRDRIEARKRDEEVHKAFVVDKAKTLSMMGKDEQRVSQEASELACSLALAKSCEEISNPYHRLLRETVEEGSKLDVLRELGGYEEALEKMGEALRKGMVRERDMMISEEEQDEEGVGWLALKMFGAKEAEKIALSHEEALKICLSSNLPVYFTTMLSKLMIMSSRFLLREEELLDIFRRCGS